MWVNHPLISTIIPVYNGELYLGEAIKSVLEQSYPNVEIMVVDDGSTDSTAQVSLRFGELVHYFYQENAGLSAARNAGIKRAKGEYLAFLDADDLFVPQKFEQQYACFRDNPDLDMIFGQVEHFYSPDLPEEERKRFAVSDIVMLGLFAGAMLVRREAFERVGFFDPSLRVGQFLDWYMKAREQGLKQTALDEVVVKRRIHRSNMSSQASRDDLADFARLIKFSLDRRRRTGLE